MIKFKIFLSAFLLKVKSIRQKNVLSSLKEFIAGLKFREKFIHVKQWFADLPSNRNKMRIAGITAGAATLVIVFSVYGYSLFNSVSVDKKMYGEAPAVDNSILRIIQGTPSGRLEGKDRKKEVTVVFNHPMTALAALDEKTKGVFEIVPAIKGSFRWYGSRVCAFIPEKGWDYGATYEVKIKKGTSALNGKKLAEDHSFSFTFDIPSMDASCGPMPYKYGTVDYDQSFYLRFSYPVSAAAVKKYFSLTNKGRALQYKIEFSSRSEYYSEGDEDSYSETPEADRKTVVITPSAKYAFDSDIELKIAAGIRSEQNDAELKAEKLFTYKTHGPLTVEFNDSAKYFDQLWDSGIKFSNEVDYGVLKKNIIFTPAAQWRGGDAGRTKDISFSMFKLIPGRSYKVRVNQLSDVYGNRLKEAEDYEFTAPDIRPSFSLKEDSKIILESPGSLTIPVDVSSISSLDVSTGTFTIKQIGEALEGDEYGAAERIIKRIDFSSAVKWDTGLKNNQWGLKNFPLQKYLSPEKKGWIAMSFEGDMLDYQGKQVRETRTQIIQATDMGLSVKEAFDASHVWVHSLSTGLPVKNAEVVFYDGTSKTGSAVTDASGYTRIKNPSGDLKKHALYMISSGKSDRAFAASRMHNLPMYYISNHFSDKAYLKSLIGEIIFDRKLYRPGDTVQFKGVLSYKEKGKVYPAKGEDIKVTIHDSKGEEIFSKKIKTSDQGGVWASYEISQDAALGHFRVNLIGSGEATVNDTFQVEEFRPVSFKVDVDGMKDSKVGTGLKLEVEGQYLFGAPMKDAPVNYSFMRLKRRAYFERYDGFVFGDGNIWSGDDVDWSQAGFYTGGSGMLGAAGKFSFSLVPQAMSVNETIHEPAVTLKLSDMYELKIEAKVRDVDDKSVTKSATAKIFPGSAMFGIKAKDRYQTISSPFVFDLVAVANNGSPAGEKSAVVYVIKYEYKSILSKGPGGTLQPRNSLVKKIVQQQNMSLSGDPRQFTFTAADPGSYTILVQEQGGLSYSRDSFYAWGGDPVWWQTDDDDSITLVPDKKEYQPGETARVLIQSPFSRCTAIITLERESVIWQKTIEITEAGTPVEIPMKDEYLPNVYLSVMLIRPRINLPDDSPADIKRSFIENDLGAPKFKAGIVKLSVSNASKRMKFKISTDRADYSPGDNVTVTLNTEPGAEIAITAADRGVLDLIDYRYADPVNKFFQNWQLAVKILENRRFIIKQYRSTQKGESPGGQGKGDELEGLGGFDKDSEDGARRDIRYTAYWNPSITADKDGRAVFTFKLPHNLTTFRFMSLAARNGRFASGEHEVKVRKAVVIQKNVPRFIRPGDTLSMGAVIINQTGVSGRFNVSLNSELLGGKKYSTTVEIGAGASKDVAFPVSLDNIKYAAMKKSADESFRKGKPLPPAEVIGWLTVAPENMDAFTSKGYPKKEITDKLEFKFPVREQAPEEAFTIAGFTDKKENEFIRIPADGTYLPSMGSFDVTLSSSALSGLGRGFSFFMANPYFCLEQRASAYLLAVTSGDLLNRFGYNPPSEIDYNFSEIQKLFLTELREFQNSDGGFRPWKKSGYESQSSPYLTAYIVFVLETARQKEYSIDSGLLADASSYLKSYIKNPPKDNYSYVLETFAMINFTLALQNSYNSSMGDFLLDNRKDLSMRALAYCGMAVALDKDMSDYNKNKTVKEIRDYILNHMSITTRKVSFKEYGYGEARAYGSSGSTASVVMRFLMLVDRNNPLIPSIAQYLIADAGVWGDSHGSGIAAVALHDYHELYEKRSSLIKSFSGDVILNGKEIFSADLNRSDLSISKYSLPLFKLAEYGKPGINLPLDFASSGGNRMYYTASLVYYPALTEVKARDEGIEVQREIIDLSIDSGKKSVIGVNKGALKRGEVYMCRIRLVVTKPSFNVVVNDPLPSNVEIVNTSFATEKKSLASMTSKDKPVYQYWWMASPPNIEYRDDRVLITQDYMDAGMHEFTYLIRPILRGKSAAPAAGTKLMYEPEIFGRTAGGSLTVK